MKSDPDRPHAEDRILAALDDMPDGLGAQQVMSITGLSRTYFREVCGRMVRRGAIVYGRLLVEGCTTRLLLARPEHATTMLARCDAERVKRAALAREKRRLRSLTAAERKPSYVAAAKWADADPTHRVVAAHLAKPLVKRGPASVFELAAVSA
jgi:hypothetical protein